MRPGEFKIIAALMDEPNGLTYTKIGEITGLSDPVLSGYLSGLTEIGMILKNPVDKHYLLTRAYQQRNNLADLERSISSSMHNIPLEGGRIAQVRNHDLRRKIYEDFFSFHMSNISILIAMAIRNSVLSVFKENMEKEGDFWKEFQSLKKKDVKRFAEQTMRYWEASLTQYHSLLQEKLLNWVIPYVQMLALAYIANAEFTLPGIDKELPERFTKEAVTNTFWFKQLEAIDQKLASRDPKFAQLLKESAELEKKASD